MKSSNIALMGNKPFNLQTYSILTGLEIIYSAHYDYKNNYTSLRIFKSLT